MKIELVSNLNTIDLREFKRENPLSYAYLCFQEYLKNFNNMELIYINEDKYRVYFKIKDLEYGKNSYIMDISKEELLKRRISVYKYYIEECLKNE